jgi:pSer/pThr/pTyr-binding forkhead associated (FHA) protein
MPESNGKQISSLVNAETRERIALVAGQRLAVGRNPDNDLQLPNDIYASGTHAVIYFEEGQWWVEDLNSTNGTFRNGAQVFGKTEIQHGDLISFGRSKFEIE